MDLIPQLKEEHIEILRYIENLTKLNKDINSELQDLKKLLIQHVELEDKLLYPVLDNSKEKELKELGEQFSKEMAAISKVAMTFFNKYLNKKNLSKNKEFKEEAKEIKKAVSKRVKIEEDILFPAYEKYIK